MSILGDHTRAEKAVPPRERFDATLGDRYPMRILLAEDNVINQKVAVRLLERMGYRADIVSSGKEAIQALRRQTYDLILMDMQMPEMDGVEATYHIRKEWSAMEGPIIVAMTANAMQEHVDECLRAGMDNFISKPIDVQKLQGVLRDSAEVLNSRKAQSR
jgi:CheY-like chemotaxis protein